MKLISILYTFYSYIIILLLVIIFFIPAIILLLLPGHWRHSWPVYRAMQFFYWLVLKLTFLKITYRGLEHIPDGPVVFAANHQSALDVPLLGSLTRGEPHIWLARNEVLENFFLIRFIVPRIAIIVDITTPRTAMLSLLSIIKLAQKENRHVMIFPEGGRFTNGTVQKFYGGFALLVRRLGRPVIPVYIQGVEIVYPPNSWWASPAPITVTIGAPMMPEPGEDDAHFKDRVHRWFLTNVR